MNRLIGITKNLLIVAFPILVLSCGGTGVNEANDHDEMMEDEHGEMMEGEHEEMMEGEIMSDTLNHEMDEEEMMPE